MVLLDALTILALHFYQIFVAEGNEKRTFNPDAEKKAFQDRCLKFHNLIRLLHGAPPLAWDETLAESSQAWANHLSTIQKVVHSEAKYGENIYASNQPKDIDLICEYACKAWYKEWKKYNFDNPGYSKDTGHFTQMVWKSTTRVGIGEAGQADGKFFIVAKYYPPGNMDGQFSDNVRTQGKVSNSCLPILHIDQKELKKLMDGLHIKNSERFFSNEPCTLYNQTTDGDKEEQTSTGTQEKQGSNVNVGTSGTVPDNIKEQSVVVAIPINEPTTAQEPPLFIVTPPVQQVGAQPSANVAIAGPVSSTPPLSTNVSNASPPTNVLNAAPSGNVSNASPPSNVAIPMSSSPENIPSSRPVVTREQNVMNPPRATNAFDPSPGKKSNLLKRLRGTPKH